MSTCDRATLKLFLALASVAAVEAVGRLQEDADCDELLAGVAAAIERAFRQAARG